MKKTLLLTLAGASLLGLAANAAITMYAAWDLNEGSGSTTTQYQLGTGETWNQVTNPAANLAATASDAFSTATGLAWGTASTAPNSTASLSFANTNGQNTLETNVSGAGLAGTGAKTFVAWINLSSTANDDSSILAYSPGGGATNGADLRFLINGSGQLRGEVSGGFFLNNTVDLRGDGWTMVAAIFDGNTTTSKFYIGGVGLLNPTSSSARAIDTAGTVVGTPPAANINVIIGNYQVASGSGAFDGGIDMAAIYTGAATLAELDAIYANGIAVPEPSTYALIGGVLALVCVMARRRS